MHGAPPNLDRETDAGTDTAHRVARLASARPVDPDSFAPVIQRHQAGVWRYLRALGSAADLADDLTQEVFLTAFDRGLRDVHPASTASYLRKIARHLYLRTHRTARRREEILADAADLLWERDCGEDDGEEWLDALRSCLSTVDERGRRVITRFYRDGASRSEVARELEMKENGVKTLLHRIRGALRDCVRRKMS